jgi:drug/metabolite transporter (DMT)-like permease
LGLAAVLVNLVGISYGVKLTDATTAAAFQCIIPPLSFVLSFAVGYETVFSRWKAVSLLLAVAGNAVVVEVWTMVGTSAQRPPSDRYYYLGCLLLLMNISGVSTFLVFQKPIVAALPRIDFLFRVYLLGVPCTIIVSSVLLLLESSTYALSSSTASFVASVLQEQLEATHWLTAAAMFHTGSIGLVVPYSVIAWSMRSVPPTVPALYFTLQPLVAAVLGRMLLDEMLSWWRIIGGSLILSGLVLGAIDPTGGRQVASPTILRGKQCSSSPTPCGLSEGLEEMQREDVVRPEALEPLPDG